MKSAGWTLLGLGALAVLAMAASGHLGPAWTALQGRLATLGGASAAAGGSGGTGTARQRTVDQRTGNTIRGDLGLPPTYHLTWGAVLRALRGAG